MSHPISAPAAPANLAMQQPRHGWARWLGWGLILALLAASWHGADMRPYDLWHDRANIGVFLADFFPPNFHDWRIYVQEMLVTVKIALWGTALSVVTALPLGLLASSNIVPVWVRQPVRRLLDLCRAINEMVFAMLFVAVVGLGPFAGVLALWVHTTGVLAKLFSEAVEAIDPQPVEGIRATGASALHEIAYGVLPQVMPLWISFTLYRFESNVRSAAVVGMVGAGGIGEVLWEIIRAFQYSETAAVMIIVALTVTAIDVLSSGIRKWMV